MNELKTLQDLECKGKTHGYRERWISETELKAEVIKIKNSCIRNDVFDLQMFGLKMLKFFEIKDLEIKKECGFHNPRGYANMGKFVRLTEKEIEELKQKIKDLEENKE